MSTADSAKPYYYSTQHLVRDFVGTVAPFTVFLAAAYVTLPAVRAALEGHAAKIPASPHWLLITAAIGVYILVGYVAGALMNRLVLFYKLAGGVRRRGIDALYNKNGTAITNWYEAYVPNYGKLEGPATPEPVQMTDRLIGLFRIYNPDGYLHVYREYTFLFIYRLCIGYAVLLAIAAGFEHSWTVAVCSVGTALLFCVVAMSGLKQAVEAEFNFIVSTVAWLEDSRGRTAKAR